MLRWPYKDPDEVLDYEIDWSARLNGDTIASSTFTLPPGATLVADDATNTTTSTKIWLSGGTEGQTYFVMNEVVTSAGRTMDQTVKIKIKTK
jgi:hypothetical protein